MRTSPSRRILLAAALALAAGLDPARAATPLLDPVSAPPSNRAILRLRDRFQLPARSLAQARAAAQEVGETREAVARRMGAGPWTPDEERRATDTMIDAFGLRPLPALGERIVRNGAIAFWGLYADVLDPGEPMYQTYEVEFPPGADLEAIVRNLAGAEEVLWAEQVRYGGPLARNHGSDPLEATFPNDPRYGDQSQWGLSSFGGGPFCETAGNDIRMNDGWSVTTGNSSVIIAVLDTGIDSAHVELKKTLFDGTSRIVSPYEVGLQYLDWGVLHDPVGHGTAVAGVAAALTHNGSPYGNAGLPAPCQELSGPEGIAGVCGGSGADSVGCRILPVKITPGAFPDAGSDYCAVGLIWAVNHGARAANISFEFWPDTFGPMQALREAMTYAAVHGCVVSVAAGNTPGIVEVRPGNVGEFGYCITVSALAPNGSLAAFSTQGPQVTVAAPGESMVLLCPTYENYYESPNRNYVVTGGTSFAAPIVAGLAGLATSLQPTLVDNEFEGVLRATARDYGAPGRDDQFGSGVPDAGALLQALEPPNTIVRGSVATTTWTLANTEQREVVSLDAIHGCAVSGMRNVETWEARARVWFGPCFNEPPIVVVRRNSTNGFKGTGRLHYSAPDGEVVPGSVTEQGCEVRSFVYYIEDAPSWCPDQSPQGWWPRPPQEVVIGWSAIGETLFGCTPVSVCCNESASATSWDTQPVFPNPSHGHVDFRIRGGTRASSVVPVEVAIHDVRGRRVRVIRGGVAAGEAGTISWDGRDEAGRRATSGVYFARLQGAPGERAEAVRFSLLGQ